MHGHIQVKATTTITGFRRNDTQSKLTARSSQGTIARYVPVQTPQPVPRRATAPAHPRAPRCVCVASGNRANRTPSSSYHIVRSTRLADHPTPDGTSRDDRGIHPSSTDDRPRLECIELHADLYSCILQSQTSQHQQPHLREIIVGHALPASDHQTVCSRKDRTHA